MPDGKAEFEITVAPEVGIELLDIIVPAVALHIAFRRAKCTLRLGEYFFSLDVGHSGQSRKERIAAVIDYLINQWFQFVRIKIYIRHWYHPFFGSAHSKTCDPSAAPLGAVECLGIPSILLFCRSREAAMHAEGGHDRRAPPRAAEGVTGGHRVAWRLLSRGRRAQALGVVCQVGRRS